MARVGALWIVGGVAALVGWPAGAASGTLPPNASDAAAFARFKQLDRDGSLKLPPDALSSRRAARHVFAILDLNGDGRLTATDGSPARHLLSRMRTHTLSAKQFTTLATSRWIAALDVDGDGGLSLAELRPSLAGNAPLDDARRPSPAPALVEPPARPQSCWIYDGTRWVELPASTPTCRMR